MKTKFPIMERRKHFLIAYIVGCLISMVSTGIKNVYYLIPIKLFGLIFALLVGNGLYYESKGLSRPECTLRIFKYIALTGVLIGIAVHYKFSLLSKYNIDITPFIGFPEE